MKSLTILMFLFASQLHSCAQNDSVFVKISMKNLVVEDVTQATIRIELSSKSVIPIAINDTPMFVNNSFNGGDIRLNLEQIEDSCFIPKNVSMDYFSDKFKFRKDTVQANRFVCYQYNMGNIFFMPKGLYRIRVSWKYFKNDLVNEKLSNWVYFIVNSNKPLRLADGPLFYIQDRPTKGYVNAVTSSQ